MNEQTKQNGKNKKAGEETDSDMSRGVTKTEPNTPMSGTL